MECFLNIEQKNVRIIFSIFHVFFTFYAISNINKKNSVTKNVKFEKCPFTYWLNGRWFLQIVDRDSWNLYMWGWVFFFGGGNIFLAFYAISMWVSILGGGGGGGMFFLHFMLFPTFLETFEEEK